MSKKRISYNVTYVRDMFHELTMNIGYTSSEYDEMREKLITILNDEILNLEPIRVEMSESLKIRVEGDPLDVVGRHVVATL